MDPQASRPMSGEEYLRLSERTERKFPNGLHLTSGQAELLHAGMGMVTEAAEYMDQMKKHLIYGAELDTTNLLEEVGDDMWYHAIAIRILRSTIADVQARNIEKLRVRFPDKFNEHDALNRNLVDERATLETGHTPREEMRKLWDDAAKQATGHTYKPEPDTTPQDHTAETHARAAKLQEELNAVLPDDVRIEIEVHEFDGAKSADEIIEQLKAQLLEKRTAKQARERRIVAELRENGDDIRRRAMAGKGHGEPLTAFEEECLEFERGEFQKILRALFEGSGKGL